MKKENKISDFLRDKLNNWGFKFKTNKRHHPGCWGKSCEGKHWITELTVWKRGNSRETISFHNCSDVFILGKLSMYRRKGVGINTILALSKK